ncbi:MAG: pyrophosphohydrolase [Thermoleophilia bacterium]|nr:pyrophosphohydrolase [Thermoleophilia bacterium]
MTEPLESISAVDRQHGVPGDERTRCAMAMAAESAALDAPSFATEAWRRAAELDADAGLGTRIAARAVLQRSDGRFLLFRYDFHDGTQRFIIPGGGAEAGEDPTTAARREVLEETGTAPHDLRFSGLVLFHLLTSSLQAGRTPTVQYSPIMLGTIDDDLPDTGGRQALWFSVEEFAALPPRPLTEPILAILRAAERGETIAPRAVWLPG